jgi:choline dehydrogenase
MHVRLSGDFENIVIGAGTAGCVVANRLSTRSDRRVLLLEAGGSDRWIWFHVPVGYLFAIGNPRADWMFRTEPELGLHNRSLAYPRGKVLGGSSAINAMICMRGQAADYDGWAKSGLSDWSWAQVLPIFRNMETHFLGATEFHGSTGQWNVEPARLRWDVLDAVMEAASQYGIPKVSDFNTGENEGVGYFHVNQKRGRRWSAARGFLSPALRRPNLRLETDVHVEKILLSGRRAVGVIFRRGDESFEARASGDIVLCAGAIGSPHLLTLSGIGRPEWIADIGVRAEVELPGVGSNLQDHLQLRSIYRVSGTKTLNEAYHSQISRLRMGLDYALRRRGPLAMAPSQLGIFTRSSPRKSRVNLEFHVQPLSLDKFGDPLHRFPAITLSVCNLRPTSRGTVRPRSPDPKSAPLISPNYLSTQEDRLVAAQSLQVARAIVRQPALQRYAPQEYLPGPKTGNDFEALVEAAGRIGTTIFHPVGTAKMGLSTESMAVVDDRLRVHKMEGLRVVDASVMPSIVSGNTNTPTAMIAEKGAEMILADSR